MKNSITVPDVHLFFLSINLGYPCFYFFQWILCTVSIVCLLFYQMADEVSCMTRCSHACRRNRCWTITFLAKVVCYTGFMRKKSLKAGWMIIALIWGKKHASCRPVESSSCRCTRHYPQVSRGQHEINYALSLLLLQVMGILASVQQTTEIHE